MQTIKSRDDVIAFGRYKGDKFKNVCLSYIEWAMSVGAIIIDNDNLKIKINELLRNHNNRRIENDSEDYSSMSHSERIAMAKRSPYLYTQLSDRYRWGDEEAGRIADKRIWAHEQYGADTCW